MSLTCVSISGVTDNVLNWSFINSAQTSRTGENSLLKGLVGSREMLPSTMRRSLTLFGIFPSTSQSVQEKVYQACW